MIQLSQKAIYVAWGVAATEKKETYVISILKDDQYHLLAGNEECDELRWHIIEHRSVGLDGL